MRITIYPTGNVVVTAPLRTPLFFIERFFSKKREWVERKVLEFKAKPQGSADSLLRRRSRREFLARKDEAKQLVIERLEHFNRHCGFAYKNISIRDQKSRWGSCSKKGNLSFSYKILFLPPELQDYLVVHELCHLKEFNHSRDFWDLVGEAIPDYSKLRRRLKEIG